jgi:ankyrin repeat protein
MDTIEEILASQANLDKLIPSGSIDDVAGLVNVVRNIIKKFGLKPQHVKIAAETNRVDILEFIYRQKILKRGAFNDVLEIGAERGFMDVVKFATSIRSYSNPKLRQAIIKSSLNDNREIATYLLQFYDENWINDICMLEYFAKNYNINYIKLLYENGIHPTHTSNFFKQLIKVATTEEIASVSLALKTQIPQKCLYEAIRLKNIGLVKFLVTDMNCDPSSDVCHSIRLAVKYGFLTGLEFLIQYDNGHYRNSSYHEQTMRELFVDALRQTDLSVIKFVGCSLTQFGIRLFNQNDWMHRFAVHAVCSSDNVELVKYLISIGVIFDSSDALNAIHQKAYACLKYLITTGHIDIESVSYTFGYPTIRTLNGLSHHDTQTCRALPILLEYGYKYDHPSQLYSLIGYFLHMQKCTISDKKNVIDNYCVWLFTKRDRLNLMRAIEIWNVIDMPQLKISHLKLNPLKFTLKPKSLYMQFATCINDWTK